MYKERDLERTRWVELQIYARCCWFPSDDKDAALVEALQLYGGTGQRVLVFVAMKKQCDVGAPDIRPLSNGKRVKMCKDELSQVWI